MRRFVAIGFGVVLVLGSASAALASPPPPEPQAIALTASTTDVSAACVEQTTPCSGTVRLAFAGTVTGAPFAEAKGIRSPQTIVGTIDIPMATYDSTTNCFTNATGLLELRVPQGKMTRLAFDLALVSGSGCNGSFVGTFEVDSSRGEVRSFRDSTGSGVFQITSDLDVENQSASALQINLSGSITSG